MVKLRRWTISIVLTAGALTGCGGDAPADPTAVVNRSSQATAETGSAETRIEIAFPAQDGDEPREAVMEGVIDFGKGRARFESVRPEPGVTTIHDSDRVYVEIPFTGGAGFRGFRYLALDLAADPAQAVTQDIAASLQALDEAEMVTRQGTDNFGGVSVTHYRTSLPVAAMVPGASGDDVPVEAWVDREDRVRRLRFTLDYSQMKLFEGLGLPAGPTVITLSFSNFGVPVEVRAPLRHETMDAREYQALKDQYVTPGALYIPSEAMAPTLLPMDRIHGTTEVGDLRRGDIVLFHSPVRGEGQPAGAETFLKRIIALPGEMVEHAGGRLLVDGRPLAEPYLEEPDPWEFAQQRVPAGHLWVEGDNRQRSSDSRVFGPIPISDVIIRVTHIDAPEDRRGELPRY